MKKGLKLLIRELPMALLILAVGYYALIQISTIFWTPEPEFALAPVRPRVIHDVTNRMLVHGLKMANSQAPDFNASDGNGRPYHLRGLVKQGPVVLVFIKDGCPCSIAAQSYYNEIANAFDGKVTFLGVIDGPQAVARQWAKKYHSVFPVLADHDLSVIKAYGVESSAHMALIDQQMKIVSLWPGFSKPMLREAHQTIVSLGVDALSIGEFTDAPENLMTGCPFDVDWPSAETFPN
ncbi:MAG: Thiol-disulfide oxidoreductase ResA [Planctomycetota bacterium]|jgi:peroxiredoxin